MPAKEKSTEDPDGSDPTVACSNERWFRLAAAAPPGHMLAILTSGSTVVAVGKRERRLVWAADLAPPLGGALPLPGERKTVRLCEERGW